MTKHLELNALVNILDEHGEPQFHKDKEAAREYFLNHVNPNTVFFHTLEEKRDYMVENRFWDGEVFEKYDWGFIKNLFKQAYAYKYRFGSFVGAYKFYQSYACKNLDGTRYLERFEDRVSMVALAVADGNLNDAEEFLRIMMTGEFQPATPTFLNAGRGDAGDLVSCFLLRVEDNMESIADGVRKSLQLSKRGGGVALLLTNLRESGARIKNVEGAASGVVPVMKILEDSFSYANQLGARQGAGAVYLHANHPDIMRFLDTKRENADEKIRIKTLSLGVVVPDIAFELARSGEDMYLFSPYDVEREYGVPLSDIGVTKHYQEMVDNPRIHKTKLSARKFFQTIAELQFESGYPYLMFEDTVNRANPVDGYINMTNLCSEILQTNTPTEYNPDGGIKTLGQDISCNLGSLNIANVVENLTRLPETVAAAVRFLTNVSGLSTNESAPSVATGNNNTRAIGLGQMNLHGYLAQQGIEYGSEEALDFLNTYLTQVRYWALWQSNQLAKKTSRFQGFEKSKYATGEALQPYENNPNLPKTKKVVGLFTGGFLARKNNWVSLNHSIRKHGLANAYLLAIPPTGNISYVNGATPSIHPVTSPVEIRKEGKMGRVYYPAPGLTKHNLGLFKDAYSIGAEKLIDTYAVANKHTDQGCSLTLFFTDQATTRDLNKAYIRAWRSGVKTIYYLRVKQAALEGTETQDCLSCTL